MIDIERLVSAGIARREAEAFLQPLLDAFARFRINTPLRQAAFVGQAAHESHNFARLEESLHYRSAERLVAVFGKRFTDAAAASAYVGRPEALANRVYANRLGNGDETSGDGWRYRGRGVFQLTGRSNYAAAGEYLARPYEDQPDLVARPDDACLTAAWYWTSIRGNELADAGNTDAITRAINGPRMLEADERRRRYEVALRAFL